MLAYVPQQILTLLCANEYFCVCIMTYLQVLAELDADPTALDVLQRRIHRWYTLRMAATVHTITGQIISNLGPQ